jgi:hypothetical protein
MGDLGYLAFGASMIWLVDPVLGKLNGSRDRRVILLALLPLCGGGAAVLNSISAKFKVH